MSQSMAGNHDYEYATAAVGAANANAAKEFNADVRADALIYATLALAYEKRTANLIALMGWMGSHGAVSKQLAAQIDERIGLA